MAAYLRCERHLRRCGQCRTLLGDYQGVRDRLRGIHVPAPDPDLTARILAAGGTSGAAARLRPGTVPHQFEKTGDAGVGYAETDDAGAACAADTGYGSALSGGAKSATAGAGFPGGGRRRVLVLTGSSAAAVVLSLLAAGYVVGGQTPARIGPMDVGPAHSGATPAGAGQPAAVQSVPVHTAAVPADPEQASPDRMLHSALVSSRLAALQAAGWKSPGLAGLGLGVVAIKRFRLGTQPGMELVLSYGSSIITVDEQHAAGPAHPHPTKRARPGTVPVYLLSGRSAANGSINNVSAAGTALRLPGSGGWEAVVSTPDARYTVATSGSLAVLDPVVEALEHPGAGAGQAGSLELGIQQSGTQEPGTQEPGTQEPGTAVSTAAGTAAGPIRSAMKRIGRGLAEIAGSIGG